MNQRQQNPLNTARRDEKPWYKQFWPWFIIALPLTAVLASFNLLWLAINSPDRSVLNESEYRVLKSELKAQPVPDTKALEIEVFEAESQKNKSPEKTKKPGSQSTP